MYHGVTFTFNHTQDGRAPWILRGINQQDWFGATKSGATPLEKGINLTRSTKFYTASERASGLTYLFFALLLPGSMRVALQFLNNVCFTEIAAPITRADQITLALSPQGFSVLHAQSEIFILRKSEAAPHGSCGSLTASEWMSRVCDSA